MKRTVKIVVAGEGGVGKTSFLNRLVHNFFNNGSELTKGVDFFSKIIHINGREINFIMWDFAGQHQFKEILDDFVYGSIAAFILFDLTRINTFENVCEWINKLKGLGEIPIIILGTKYDLIDKDNCFSIDEHILKAIYSFENVLDYVKISSKTGVNVNHAFNLIIKKLNI